MKNFFKKAFYIIIIIILGITICYISGNAIRFGIYIPMGWAGWYMDNLHGFPFYWISLCPKAIDYSITTGCLSGTNVFTFYANIVFYSIILHIIFVLLRKRRKIGLIK